MRRILITGASGFIGGKLAEFYAQSDSHVRLLIRNPAGLPGSLNDRCEIAVGDITQPETLKTACESIDVVIHSAGMLGQWGVTYSLLHRSNVTGTLNMLQAAYDAGVKRFVHLSAGGVTGPVGSQPADEQYPPQPITDYERSKWEGEKQALEWSKEKDYNLIVLRPTFTYGPGDPHKLKLFQTVQKGRFFFIGGGLSTVHPVYIDDLVAGIDLGIRSDVKGECIIIGGSHPVTKAELINRIADVLGCRRPHFSAPVPVANLLTSIAENMGRLFNFTPPLTSSRVLALSQNWGYSITKAREQLNYNPSIELDEGLRRTVLWYREHGLL
jgi:dihydroflavonol-4-reductase